MRQPGEAAMSKVPGPGTAQGGQCLLLTGLLQGKATSLPVRVCMLYHVLHSVSGGCGSHDVEYGMALLPSASYGIDHRELTRRYFPTAASLGGAQEGAPKASGGFVAVHHEAGARPQQGDARV